MQDSTPTPMPASVPASGSALAPASMPSSAPAHAFSEEIRTEFQQWVRRPDHTNRARMTSEKHRILRMFLRTPALRPVTKLEIDICTQVHGYRLDEDPASNKVWRLRDSGHPQDREVILEACAFEMIIRAHCQHAHPGKNKTFDLIREKYYGITKEEVSECLIYERTKYELSISIGCMGS